jgi:hypothetical protein
MRNTAEKKFVQPLLELRQRDAETRQEPRYYSGLKKPQFFEGCYRSQLLWLKKVSIF